MTWTEFSGTAAEWDERVTALGGTFYQCFGWGEVRRSAGWHPLRFVGTADRQPVSAACVLVRRLAGAAVCWIPGGPAGPLNYLTGEFRKAIVAAAGTPFVYCRINDLREAAADSAHVLKQAGWRRPMVRMASGLTMAYPLAGEPEQRLALASGNWRHNLRRSARHGLAVERWTDPDPRQMADLYREMEALKSLPPQHSEAELTAMVAHLGERLVVFRCLDADGRLIALRAAGVFAGCGWDLLAAAGAAARKVYASHGTLWALLEACRSHGAGIYDLSGVDPVGNKGVFDFKQGTGARLVECVGEWDWASIPGMRTAVNLAFRLRGGL